MTLSILLTPTRVYSVGDKGIRTVRPSVGPSVRPAGSISRRLLDSVFSNFIHVFYDHWAGVIVRLDRKQLKMTDWRPFLLIAMHYHNRRRNMVENAGLHGKHHVYASSAVGNHSRTKFDGQLCSAMLSHGQQPW